MTITITAFEASPDEGMGLARDMTVRWVLEEAGLPYEVRLLSFEAMKQPVHLARQPFGQIPTFEEGDLTLFESGAIVLHIAQNHPGLLPDEANARTRAISWMFSALGTVEPPIVEREQVGLLESDRSWYQERLPLIDARIRSRLDVLARRLEHAEWLESAFSAGDLMMVQVLRRLDEDQLAAYPALQAYVARGEARPAYRRAFAAQREVFIAASSRPG